jgi:pimeloyl-ACP methyl ester carboxylesterase
MLYEMARRHDEWSGEDYEGSSLRGAIQGWKNMGVCQEKLWKFDPDNTGWLTVNRAKDARSQTIGAYYRLKPEITDYHSALNETGAIAVSAQVHSGWDNPRSGVIKFRETNDGGHAFAVVGYNDDGFWVQNSWGPTWGDGGVALWTYEDWVANVMDAWAFRLALPTPQIFGKRPKSSLVGDDEEVGRAKRPAVNRCEIAGHFVHIDDGKYCRTGPYWSNEDDVEVTAKRVAERDDYHHLLIYVHGGLNSPKASARRIAAMKNVFKDNGVYPFHIMYDTGIGEELKDLIVGKGGQANKRVGGITDWTDRLIERLVRRPGTLLWNEMKQDAADAFKADDDSGDKGAGSDTLGRFINHIKKSGRAVKLHLVGHSTGAVVIAHLLQTMQDEDLKVSTCSLMAPACTVDLYKQAYLPVLREKTQIRIRDLAIYNLTDELERDDNVKLYRKSLLYLVSRAFEQSKKPKPILGMEDFKGKVNRLKPKPRIFYSNGTDTKETQSETHGGFDNDTFTMNHILRRVLGKKPARPFAKDDLKY